MSTKTTVLRAALAAMGVLAVVMPMGVQAQVPGPHPAYLHALSDLRAARHYLADGWAWGPVRHEDDLAIREIDAAINEIKHASIDDGKGDHDPFSIMQRMCLGREICETGRSSISTRRTVPSTMPGGRRTGSSTLRASVRGCGSDCALFRCHEKLHRITPNLASHLSGGRSVRGPECIPRHD
jgi:hypothetical protein